MAASVWKGHLTFGLVSIPVRLYRAARKERVRLHYVKQEAPTPASQSEPEPEELESGPELHEPARPIEQRRSTPDEAPPPAPVSRVEQSLVRKGDQAPVDPGELARGYEYEPERYVVIDQQELRKLRRKTSPEMPISRFVRLEEIDPLYFETSYYVIPDSGGEKPYAILFAVLKKAAHVALADVAMHGRDHVVVVRAGRSGLIAHTMFYTDEIRAEQEFRTDVSLVSAKEMELASAFVELMRGPFDPEEFKDTYREELRALIEGKAAQQAVAPAAAPRPAAAPVDILEALKASLTRAKKPEAPAETPVRKAPEKVTEMRRKPQRRKA